MNIIQIRKACGHTNALQTCNWKFGREQGWEGSCVLWYNSIIYCSLNEIF